METTKCKSATEQSQKDGFRMNRPTGDKWRGSKRDQLLVNKMFADPSDIKQSVDNLVDNFVSNPLFEQKSELHLINSTIQGGILWQ